MPATKTRRRTYEARTRANTQGARVLAEAFCRQVEYVETEEGYRIRQWRPEDKNFTFDDVAAVLRGKRAFENDELLEQLPPSEIKYAVTKGWLLKHGTLLFVTEKAAAELSLPRRTAEGVTIKFAKVPA